ncbi:hypothetical protein P7D22_22790, partial [Lichenihabitans sp. Uapishka_5]|uniref:hypothetical protein n=1 Tax=Lichenihabitans sp. Uapishka_5 TaxID=3037302 RepID=UPI0029E7DC08
MREPARSPRREAARRVTVRLLFVFYGLLLAEGPLRKWVLPGASNALVFLRDPVMLMILLAAAVAGPSRGARQAMALFAAVVLGCLACVTGQLAGSDVAPLAILAGLRNYFLFVPLAWIVADTVTAVDYARWLRLNLWLAGPIGLLVVVQYRSAPTSFINAVPGGGNDGVFLLVADVVRPYGLFSFTLGHSVFAAWMVGVLLAGFSARRRFNIGPWLAAAGALGTLAMGACSGSRTTLLLAAAVLLAFLLAALASPVATQRRRAM